MRDGIDYGVLLMGIVAIVWVLDSFVAIGLAFPRWSAWRQSFAFRWRSGGYRLLFDVHRSGGVWVFAPAGGARRDGGLDEPGTAGDAADRLVVLAPLADALRLAWAEASRRGWAIPPGALFYSPEYRVYGVGFFEPGQDHGDGGLGNPWLYLSDADGRLVGADVPGEGSAGDLFMQAQFPLHSGRILGVPGRVLASAMGLVVAALSATGVVIWARKLRARRRAARLAEAEEAGARAARRPSPSGQGVSIPST